MLVLSLENNILYIGEFPLRCRITPLNKRLHKGETYYKRLISEGAGLCSKWRPLGKVTCFIFSPCLLHAGARLQECE